MTARIYSIIQVYVEVQNHQCSTAYMQQITVRSTTTSVVRNSGRKHFIASLMGRAPVKKTFNIG